VLTAEQRAKINQALTTCNGDRKLACEMLNVTGRQLRDLIYNNPDLKSSWSTPKARASEVELMDGPRIVAEIENPVVNEATQAKFAELMKATGATEDDLKVAMSLQEAYGKHTSKCVDMVGGGLVKRAISLGVLLDKMEKQLDEGFHGEDAGEQFATWNETYAEANKNMIRIMEVLTASEVARAKVKLFASQASGGKGNNRNRPSFGPKTAIIAQNVTVEK